MSNIETLEDGTGLKVLSICAKTFKASSNLGIKQTTDFLMGYPAITKDLNGFIM